MNSVMEELATVLSYRAEQLGEDQNEQENDGGAAAQSEVKDIEDVVSSQKVSDSREVPKDDNRKRKRRRIYRRKGGPPMGAIPENGGAGGSGVLALCLSSRRNMCVHERVMEESDREAVDAACRSMTATWVIERAAKNPGSIETCPYYDNFHAAGESTSLPSGVYDLEELKKWGQTKG
eukprot:4474620-Ditylum_brightwellii.AAC.1